MPRTIPREVRLQEFPSSLFVHPHVFVVLCDRAIHVEIFFQHLPHYLRFLEPPLDKRIPDNPVRSPLYAACAAAVHQPPI